MLYSSGVPPQTKDKLAISSGNFGNEKQVQCTAKSKRSGVQCKAPAIAGSPTSKCRMHGGGALVGTGSPGFKDGRYSKYLPAELDALYREALANPDLIEMADHIALLEARIQSILAAASEGDPVPQWKEVRERFADVQTVCLAGKFEEMVAVLESMQHLIEAGERWDTTWAQITSTMEQLRKLTDTEVKRKKELNQMVPVERVVILMAAVGAAVRRNVKDPAQVDAVYRELAILHQGHHAPGSGQSLVPANVINVGPESRGIGGGTTKRAQQRRKLRERKEAVKGE